ncbi:MAG: hypothetical protein IJJ61_01565 [Clostridia bacterium]|nr:hypothetical protein [Clostridia bacterium]
MKKALAIILCLVLAGSCLVCLSACGKQDLTNSQYLGTWKATSAKFKGEDVDIKEALKDDEFIVTLNGDGTAIVSDPDGDKTANWKETSKGAKVKGDDINVVMSWLGDSFEVSILGFHLILTKQDGEAAVADEARKMIINSEPVVITAAESFDNAGVTEFVCDATEAYSFTSSSEDVKWDIYVLDSRFEDGARYLAQAETPALEGDGTLKIEEGKFIYAVCSENAFTADAASDATLTIDYAAEEEAAAADEARKMIINSEPVVITAAESFENAGVTEFVCDATETYSFKSSSEDVKWDIYVLDSRFEDGARYLAQAEKPALEGDGTLKIEEGKFIYAVCSENAFTADAASDATLTIDYAA